MNSRIDKTRYRCLNYLKNSVEFFRDNKHHRERDLPAIMSNMYFQWYTNGNLHRENNLPAIINLRTKTIEYWRNGVLIHKTTYIE